MYDLYFNRIFMDPMLKGEYPKELIDDLKKHGHVLTILKKN